jgi:sialate O-acetylesterase
MKQKAIMLILCCLTILTQAQVRLPHIFGDNMVLQREKPIAVWGWANAKEKISVKFHGQTKTTVTDKNGKWKISLNPEKAGGPYELIVSGKSIVSIKNVLVGEVWICSGQSNMEWPLRATNNAEHEIAQANFPNIRHIKIPNIIASTPREDFQSGDWKVCSPETVADFTAVGYYFAAKLSKELNVPVGLINTSWGGTHSETWTSREAFESSEEFKSMIASLPAGNVEELNKKRKAELLHRVEVVQKNVNESVEEIAKWKLLEYDDAHWAEMNVPALWETQSLADVDGVIWFRKTIVLKVDEAGVPAQLELGMIDDSDETYVNGVKVGGLQAQYNTLRVYAIPPSVLKAGANVISVRITDTGGGGGIYGDPDKVKLVLPNRTESFVGKWKLRIEKLAHTGGVGPNDYPTLLFNAMINPLISFTIQGAIWYQGESNAGRAYQYRKAFPLMITDWRKHWNQGDFPFYFVQLASFDNNGGNSATGSSWAELREAQAKTLSLPQTGMVVTTDIGDSHDIHPRNKKDVGYRLAAVALGNTYGKKITFRGPSYESITISGTQAIITFKNGSGELTTPDKYGYLRGFEIAGSDQKFYPAQAFIKNGEVVVQHEQVTKPVAVRYNWADDAIEGNLFNKAGFPAEPFRSDSWKSITEGVTFKI